MELAHSIRTLIGSQFETTSANLAKIIGQECANQKLAPFEILSLFINTLKENTAKDFQPFSSKLPQLLLQLMESYTEAQIKKQRRLLEKAGALKRQLKAATILERFTTGVGYQKKASQAAQLIVQEIVEQLPAKSCLLRQKKPNGSWEQLAACGDTALLETIEPQQAPWQEGKFFMIPLFWERKQFGLIVAELQEEKTIPPLLLKKLGARSAESLKWAQSFQELWERSIRDYKTGLYNFHYFQEKCSEHLALNNALALLILDLDNFKAFNDQYGHPEGDEALAELAKKMKKVLSKGDLAARYGGDEFILAIPFIQEKEAKAKISEMHRHLKTFEQEKGLTSSIGIALAPTNGTAFYQLLTKADQALYRAKALGKNQIYFAD